jgi:hypothetical protein
MTSRNRREGYYVGHSEGRAVRWRLALVRRVRSAKARAILRRRTYAAYGLVIRADQ